MILSNIKIISRYNLQCCKIDDIEVNAMANKNEAKKFIKDWIDRGDEKQETQAFWIQLLDKVYQDHIIQRVEFGV